MAQRILVVDDDPTVSGVVCRYLRLAGIEVAMAADGLTALSVIDRESPDLVVLELMLLGLERGADDYVTKPFSPRELVLRVRSVLRRAGADAASDAAGSLVGGDLVLDVGRRVAWLHGSELTLTVRELDLPAFLIRHPSQAFRRADLLERVWDWSFRDQSTATVHVRRCEKIVDDPGVPRRIVTGWGVGYRYEMAAGHA